MGEIYTSQSEVESSADISTDDSSKPYYLRDSSIRDELEMNLSILNTQQQEKYGQVEDLVSQQFVKMFDKFMNPEQIAYFLGRQIIYSSYELVDQFNDVWESDMESINPEISEIDGSIYTRYSVGKPIQSNESSQTSEGPIVRQYWAGRFCVYPLAEEEITDVDPKWLMTEAAYDGPKGRRNETEEEFNARWATLLPYVYTNALGAIAVHEKVHGIQDYELPLPLLEGAAHYYQLEVARSNQWEVKIGSNMEQFAKLYEKFVAEVGENAHRLLFGTINDHEVKLAILNRAKEIFDGDAISAASKYHDPEWLEEPKKYIYWETHPFEKFRAE